MDGDLGKESRQLEPEENTVTWSKKPQSFSRRNILGSTFYTSGN